MAGVELTDAWRAHQNISKNTPVDPLFAAGFEAGRKLMEGLKVSVDVSTCDDDAGHRIFATVEMVQDGVLLAVEDHRNFAPNPAQPKKPVRR